MTATALTPAMREALRWPRRVSVSEWAERSIVLTEDSAEPGRYDASRTPYAREWMDSATAPWVHQITIKASTQVGKTQSALNILGHAIAEDPGPITWVMPTREDAAEYGENKVQPMIDASPVLRSQLAGERFDTRRRQINFRRCRMLFRSAVKAKELAAYPARYLFVDEAGKIGQWTGKEAAPFELARERTRTFWNHLVVVTSTPVLPEGLISTEHERGDRRRYMVPCPHCGEHQSLRWAQVKWPKDLEETEEAMQVARDAWYECEHCQQRIDDRAKQPMLEAGVWVPEAWQDDVAGWLTSGQAVDRAPHRSYHIWAGYSPWLTWWEIVSEWFRSRGTPAMLQNFINSWLAEEWVEKVEDPTPQLLRECVGGYRSGSVPEAVQVITVGVDVQKRFLVYTVRGWGFDMESWLLAHGRVDDFDALEGQVLARPWARGLSIRGMFVDSRYRQSEVVDFARKYPGVVRMLRGDEFDTPLPFSARKLERHPRTGAPLGLLVWYVNVGLFKDEVASSIHVGGQAEANAFHVYADVDEDYCRELTAEHKIVVRKGNRERERWVPKHGRRQNHYWDTEVYNRAMAKLLRVDSLRAGQPTPARRDSRPARGRRRPPRIGFGGAQL